MTNRLSRGCVSTVFLSMISAVAALLLSSCQSRDYYVEQAVEDGREFAINHLRNLSPLQLNYIRYNKPVLMQEDYMSYSFKGGFSQGDNNKWSQMCMVWDVPGEKLPVIVFGISEHGIRGWTPNRVICRKFMTRDYRMERAIHNAVLYVVNNMLFLPETDISRVRFSTPDIYFTNYSLDFSGKSEKFETLSKKLKSQISMAWPATETGRRIVITGISADNFSGWVPVTGLLEKEDDLKAHVVKPIK